MLNPTYYLLLALVVATSLSFSLGCVFTRLANQTKAVDSVQAPFSWRTKTAYSGIFIAFTLGAIILCTLYHHTHLTWIVLLIASASVLINFSEASFLSTPVARLLLACLASGLLLVSFFHFHPATISLLNKSVYVLAAIFFVLSVGLMRSYQLTPDLNNFIMSETIFFLLAASLGLVYTNSSSHILPYVLVLLGASLGFLFWNRQFLARSNLIAGNTFLAFILSYFLVYTVFYVELSVYVWIIWLSTLWVDVLYVGLIRLFSRKSLLAPHQTHLCQILLTRWGKTKKLSFMVFFYNVFWLLPLSFLCVSFNNLVLLWIILATLPTILVSLALGAGKTADGNTKTMALLLSYYHKNIGELNFLARWTFYSLLVAGLGFLVYDSSGWYWRLPAQTRNIVQQKADPQQYHLDNFGGAGFPTVGWIYGQNLETPNIVLIGDSHAQMLSAGLHNILGEKLGQKTYIASLSCLVLPHSTRITPGVDWDKDCPATLQNGLDEFKKTQKGVLMISESWVYQISRAAELPSKKPLNINFKSTNYADYAAFTHMLDALISDIGNKTLIVVGDVPGAGVIDTSSCMNRPFISANMLPCQKKMDTPITFNQAAVNLNQVLAEYVKRNKNTYFLSPYEVFCSGGYCHSLGERGEVYYSDQNHLSKAGSQRLMTFYQEQIMDIINQTNKSS